MRKLFTILMTVLLSTNVWSQSPQKMSYQAVIRDASNNLVTNHAVGMRVSILQSSVTGTVVYIETQTPTTNANGLVTFEIGGGIPLTGTFTNIDWANGPYFIKSETDPTGGTNYTITGTSQLLSVPYALYAKTAGSNNNTSGHYIGELFGGGVVFYVDNTGQHGLICSMIDLSTSQVWSNIDSTNIGAQSDWNGQANTIAIINQPGQITSAAKLCHNYTNVNYGTGVYSDWYLPAMQEMNKLSNSLYEVQKAIYNYGNSATVILDNGAQHYWSSTQPWFYVFTYNGADAGNGLGELNCVRAIRAF